MAKKRFTDIEIWDKEWYMDLTPKHKCLMKYIFDKCDASGCWKANWKLASLHIGENVNFSDLKELPKDQYEILDSGKIFIKDFIKFQYGKLSRECRPHIPIIDAIEKNGLMDKLSHLIEQQGTSVKALRKRLTDSAKQEIFRTDDYQCQYCGERPGTDSLFVDHIISLSSGGDNSDINLITSCQSCNSKKHDDDVFEFINKHKINPLVNLSKKLNTLFKGINTLQEEDKDKEEEVDKEEEIITPYEIEKKICPEMLKIFCSHIKQYMGDKIMDYPSLLSIANFLHRQGKLGGSVVGNMPQILEVWEIVCQWVASDNFYCQKSLKTISNHIQEIINKTQNGTRQSINGKNGTHINGKNAGAQQLLAKIKLTTTGA